MPTPNGHFSEELQELLDDRLDAATRDAVEQHLETCAVCRREFDALSWTKQVAAKHLAAPPAPAGLHADILAALQTAQRAETPAPRADFRQRLIHPFVAWAAMFIGVALLTFAFFPRRAALPALAARDFRAYRAHDLRLQLETGDVRAMEAFFTAQGVAFTPRVFDLGMMDYRLVGGRVHALRGEPSTLFVYRGPGERTLLCEMFAGKVASLPAGAELRENKGIQFHIYRSGTTTAVFWQEGTVVCVLVSDIPSGDVVQLAFAKALPG